MGAITRDSSSFTRSYSVSGTDPPGAAGPRSVDSDFCLETERLALTRLTLDDAPLMLAVWNDPAFIRYVGDRGIRTVADAHAALQDGAFKLYAEYGYGPYRMSRKADEVSVGICGLFRRDGLADADIGFSTLPQYCGQGFGYEAASAVIEHARVDVSLSRLTALVSPDNTASVRLIEKLGLIFEKMIRMPGEDKDVCLYAMQLSE